MDLGEVLSSLQTLGLDEDEARLYLELARSGPATSTETARSVKMNRIAAYRCLLGLRDKGFADSTLGRPMRFAAVPIDVAVRNVANALGNEIRRIESMRESLRPVWQAIARPPVEDSTTGRFRLVQGRQNIVRTLERMYEVADRDILFFVTHSGVIRGLKAGEHTLTGFASRGVTIRMLGPIDGGNLEFARRWTKFAHVRHVGIADYVRFCIVDEQQILSVINFADTDRLAEELDVGIWTDAHQYVLAQRTFFRIMWGQGMDLAEREKQIDSDRGTRRRGGRAVRAEA